MLRRGNGRPGGSHADAPSLRSLARLAHLALLVVALLGAVTLPRTALADAPGAHTVPVAVLAFDSEDAEEQADALTGALRSRVRAAQGWSLIETTQSLGMMTAAFKCPSRPPPECQQRIAEQIKAERYIFGFVTRGPTPGQVTAEIHLYQKGKADTVLRESYADNLKDSNDDTLRKIAARFVERLGGSAVGTIVVKSVDQTGEVIVDGEKHVPLANGTARIELAAGGHSVEVAPAAGPSTKRNVLVAAGREVVIEFNGGAPVEPPRPEGKSHTRKIVGGATMGAGVVLGTVAVIELVRYVGLQTKGDRRASELDKNDPVNGAKPCTEYDPTCRQIDKDSLTASWLAWGFGAGGLVALGVGSYLFFSSPASSETTATAQPARPNTRVLPVIGAGSGSLMLVGSF